MKPVKEALKQYAEHHNPRSRLILETVKVTSQDVKDTKSDWDGADSTSGWTTLEEGGARPTGSADTKVTLTIDNGNAITSLPGITGATVGVVAVQWDTGPDDALSDITLVQARLNSNTGGGQNVDAWRLNLYRVERARVSQFDQAEIWDLEALGSKLNPAGAGSNDVSFTFPRPLPAAIGIPPEIRPEDAENVQQADRRPITVLAITALRDDGLIATNVAWEGDTTDNQAVNNGHTVTRYNLTEVDTQEENQTGTSKYVSAPANGLPWFNVQGRTYTQQTIEFTGANAPTLAATPTATVEFIVEDEEPGSADGQGYVRNNGSTTWVAFTDGQTVSDLASPFVTTTGPQYEMRYIATPSTSGLLVPTVRRLGVRELTRETVSGIARIGNPKYNLDPFTFKSSVPSLPIELTRDGVLDYRDFATELFADQHAGEIEFRVWYGTTEIDRSSWMEMDWFRLANYESAGDTIAIETVHPLALTKKVVPVGTTSGQNALVFAGTTDTTPLVYEDILDAAGVPARYYGVQLVRDSTSVTINVGKTLDKPRPAKDELERIAYIEGGAVIPSGGRLKWKRIFTSTGGYISAPVEHFDRVVPLSVSPHLDRRIIQFRAPYNFRYGLNDNRGGFTDAIFVQSTAAIEKLGHADLESIQDLEEETSRWLIGSTYASAIARRTVASFRQGALVVRFASEHPKPWVELGDAVEVKTDRFVGRGVETDRALRGRLSLIGTVIEHDLEGREFAVWVPEIEGATPLANDIPITYGTPTINVGVPTVEPAGTQVNDELDTVWNVKLPVRPGYDCRSYLVGYNFSRAQSSGGASNLQNHYFVNVTTPGAEETHYIKSGGVVSNPPVVGSTGANYAFLVQPNAGSPLSDTEDNALLASGEFANRISVAVTPYGLTASTSDPAASRGGPSGETQWFYFPRLKNQTSPGRYVDGTNTYVGQQVRIGPGLRLGQNSGNPEITNMGLDFDVAAGNVTGITPVNKFGANRDVDTASDPETLWTRGGVWPGPTTGVTFNIRSTNAADTSTGAGARTVRLYGLPTWTSTETSVDVTMNGASNVGTTGTWIGFHRGKVLTSGTGGPNVGAIEVNSTGGTTYMEIAAGDGQTLHGVYFVPSVRDLYVSGYYVAMNRVAASGYAEIELQQLEDPQNYPNQWLVKHRQSAYSAGNSQIPHKFSPYMKVAGPAVLKIEIEQVSQNDTDVSGGFDGFLQSNT